MKRRDRYDEVIVYNWARDEEKVIARRREVRSVVYDYVCYDRDMDVYIYIVYVSLPISRLSRLRCQPRDYTSFSRLKSQGCARTLRGCIVTEY
jgi:hypothetical protein